MSGGDQSSGSSGNDNDGAVSSPPSIVDASKEDAEGKRDSAGPSNWTTSRLADGMKNLILDHGIDACQAQLDAYREAVVASSSGSCPMSLLSKKKNSDTPPSKAGGEHQEDRKEGCMSSGMHSFKRNSLHNNDDANGAAVGLLVESRSAAKSLAFELENDAQLNHDIIEASFDGVFLVNDFGIIRMVNRSALVKFGYERASELVGRNIRVICGHEHANMHDKYMEQYRLTRESRMIGSQREVRARRKDGTEFPCKIGIKVMEREGSNELLMVGFVRDLTWEKRTMEMIIEAKIAENLLVNMLPQEIAMRLKNEPNDNHLVADHHDSATILFADIVGFTSMSSRIAPIEVVKLLNGLFGRFDKLVDKYDLNKVKTIGDCYMVTSIPSSKSPAAMAAAICAFGLDMLDELHDFINATTTATTRSSQQQQQGSSDDEEGHEEKPLELRVGINSGPVVAGIIGTKRYMYDIWGDSVNVASRMESTGVPGKIQVTREVVELVETLVEGTAGGFTFVKRGLVDVKGKGRIETYFLENQVAL